MVSPVFPILASVFSFRKAYFVSGAGVDAIFSVDFIAFFLPPTTHYEAQVTICFKNDLFAQHRPLPS